MKLERVRIEAFKNLRNFELDFGDSSLTVFVGANGTGKSNLLEAITLIFRNVDLNEPHEFAFELEYVVRGERIVTHAGANERAVVRRDGKKTSK